VSVYVCMHACVTVYVSVYVCMCVCVCVWVCVLLYIPAYVCMYMYKHPRAYPYVPIDVCAYYEHMHDPTSHSLPVYVLYPLSSRPCLHSAIRTT